MKKLLCLSAAVAVVGGLVVGCKSFLDPGEMAGRIYREKESLTVPILNTLDKGIEEPTNEFANSTEVMPEDLTVASEDYRVGPGDLVSVAVTDLVQPGVESVRTNRVSESGQLGLQLIGPVRVSGLTEPELEQAVREAYANAGILPNAQVTVTVAEARNRAFTIYGAVNAIGQYAIVQGDTRVLDALALARGTSTVSIDTIYVIRALDPAPNAAQPMPAAPAPVDPAAPGADPLAPQGSLPRTSTDRFASARTTGPVLLQTGPVLLQTAPNADPGTGGTDDTMIMLDGKPVLKTSASTQQAPTAQVTPVAEVAPMTEAMPEVTPMAAPVSVDSVDAALGASPVDQGFAFNAPTIGPQQRVIRIPLDRLRQGDLRYNIVIKPRDLIFVPDPVAGEYYMGGHVARVGVYSLTGRNITLKQAIVSAGMMDEVAIPARTDVIRRIGPDKEIFVRVDLSKIFEGQQPDFYLKPNDIVMVGTNLPAPFLAALRNGFRLTYGFGFLYDRNFATDNNNNNN